MITNVGRCLTHVGMCSSFWEGGAKRWDLALERLIAEARVVADVELRRGTLCTGDPTASDPTPRQPLHRHGAAAWSPQKVLGEGYPVPRYWAEKTIADLGAVATAEGSRRGFLRDPVESRYIVPERGRRSKAIFGTQSEP